MPAPPVHLLWLSRLFVPSLDRAQACPVETAKSMVGREKADIYLPSSTDIYSVFPIPQALSSLTGLEERIQRGIPVWGGGPGIPVCLAFLG